MAFLQNDFPPSTAPVVVRAATVAQPRKRASLAKPVRPLWQRIGLGRIAIAALAIGAVLVPGYFVARDTESLALGILASDLTFLIAVAIGSSFTRH